VRRARAALALALVAAAPARQEAGASAEVLAARRVAAAARLRQVEEQVASAQSALAAAEAEAAAAEASLARARAAMAAMLPGMVRVASLPVGAWLVGREAMVARAVALEQARAWREAVAGLLAAREAARQRAARAREAAQALAARRGEQVAEGASLTRALAEARARAARDAAAERAASRAAEAADLGQAIARLKPGRGAGEAPGRMVVPVAGPVERAFGAATPAGPSTGIAYAPPPGAFVVAPCGGRVDYAGTFRRMGELVLLDCGRGIELVLAGLAALDVRPGQRLRAGEPLGTMPAGAAPAGGGRAALYVEVRRGGEAVDPAWWLR
jgi:murein hydrolase activator